MLQSKTKMHPLCVLGLHDPVTCTKIMSVVQQCTYNNFICRLKLNYVFLYISHCYIETKESSSIRAILLTFTLAKLIIMIQRSLYSFSFSNSAERNHFTGKEGNKNLRKIND